MSDQEERDRRSGLTRVLEAIHAVGLRIDAAAAELGHLRVRLDRIERQLSDASPGAPAEVDLAPVLRAIAALPKPAPASPGPALVLGDDIDVLDEVSERIRTAVASSHRSMESQVTASLQELKLQLFAEQERFVEQVATRLAVIVSEQGLGALGAGTADGAGSSRDAELLREVALDVEAIRRAIERAGGATR